MANDQSSSDGTADSRELGVDFGSLKDELASETYPLERETLLSKYGGYEIETNRESQTLQSILGGQEMETDSHEYESADAVHQAVLNMIGSEAIEREEYSDRGGSNRDQGDEAESQNEQSL
ncbi:hypothetical protein [Haloarcula sp. CBA1127]|uniref:DUF5789 family protein n=1 Tax=Haloarcula sp. CBA1127 TaxID=1765055 RepID=UPI00073F05C9|nr:hypothetical protein [Haloarcula sp. CBA1127]